VIEEWPFDSEGISSACIYILTVRIGQEEIVESEPFSWVRRGNWGRLQAGKPLNQGLLAGRKFLGNDACPRSSYPRKPLEARRVLMK